MRRRILQSTLLVVTITALVLGVPLAITTVQLVEDLHQANLSSRLEQLAARVENADVLGLNGDRSAELAVPPDGRLVISQPGRADRIIGAADVGPDPVEQSLPLVGGTVLRMEEPRSGMVSDQTQLVFVVVLLVVLSVGTGTVVATVTAQRLAGPLREVAHRAARLGAGDFRAAPQRGGIPELDRVSDVLDTSAAALAELVQRERSLVGDVSHQLRSRLTALQLRLDELAEHPDPSARAEAHAAIEQAERLARVLDDLLEAAKVARAAGAEPQDLKAALTAAVEEWRPTLRAAGRSLRLRVPDGLLAKVTPARLREAVGVLVDNATRHGAGPVTVSARVAGGSLQVEVTDTGPGVPDELVPHVFDRGVSVDSSTGLGLALARALVEADGGRLELSRARPPVFTVFLLAARTDDVVAVPRPATGPR